MQVNMHILEKISEFVGKWMAVVVLVIAALSMFVPKSTLWIELSWVNYLLMVVMFGMGLTLKLSDFKLVFTRPKEITIGCAAQFIVMPALAFLLSKIFGLDAALMAGVVLVGTCPGGTSSNVITYLSKGDVALSVGMTSVNTLLAPVLTPAITYLLLRTTVNVDVMAMFLSRDCADCARIRHQQVLRQVYGAGREGFAARFRDSDCDDCGRCCFA